MKLSLHSRAQKEMKKHEGSLPAGLAPPERLREGDADRHETTEYLEIQKYSKLFY